MQTHDDVVKGRCLAATLEAIEEFDQRRRYRATTITFFFSTVLIFEMGNVGTIKSCVGRPSLT